MGWFNNNNYWTCFECEHKNVIEENYSMHTCKGCRGEFFVSYEHKPNNKIEITVQTKQAALEEMTFNLLCPFCDADIFIKYADADEVITCTHCNSFFKVGIEENGSMSITHIDVEKAKQTEKFIEGQKAIDDVICSFNKTLSSSFLVSVCPQCDDMSFSLLQFNNRFTTAEIQCNTCRKKMWVNSNNGEPVDIVEEYKYVNSLIEELTPTDTVKTGIYIIPPVVITATTGSNSENKNKYRHSIPKSVKQEVWQRDGGKCVECGSNEKLEYDHIIPVSKGGANTVRNIQLLCEACNRHKSAKIQ